MKPIGYRVGTVFCVLMVVWGGCTPRPRTTLEQPPLPGTEQVDTAAVEPPPVLGEIDTSDEAVFREAQLDGELASQVQAMLLPLFFEFNSYQLSEVAVERLGQIGGFLSEHRSLRVLVEGHCDERGSSEYNMGLGENRARVVRDFLVNYGVPGIRVETTSWGEERPRRAGCSDEACHGENRRVEFKVIQR